MSKQQSELLHIATIGKTVGFRGELKLHIFTDFLEQFKKNSSFYTNNQNILTIEKVDLNKLLIKFVGYDDMQEAQKLVNKDLFTTIERTRAECHLADGEHFWFDLIGCAIIEDGKNLGSVVEVDRIAGVNYLFIQTSKELQDSGFVKRFLIPNIKPFILLVDINSKVITTNGAKDILEAS